MLDHASLALAYVEQTFHKQSRSKMKSVTQHLKLSGGRVRGAKIKDIEGKSFRKQNQF